MASNMLQWNNERAWEYSEVIKNFELLLQFPFLVQTFDVQFQWSKVMHL